VSTFTNRYKQLNTNQKQAVDEINGPLLVIAGPGTGKTELLSMRAANILKSTDTLPENILCLTFTDSGANAMRERLRDIIGPDAYKVAIHTFHSFGSEVINQNNQYFYHGAEFKPADEISSYELLRDIFDELDHGSPLAGKLDGEYTHLKDAVRAISELKQSGLTPDELRRVLDANDEVMNLAEPDLSNIFSSKISTSMLALLVPLAEKVASLARPELPAAITPLHNILALSMAHAFDEAVSTGKTNAITRWRNEWLEKNTVGTFVFKDRKRSEKLRALGHIYFSYLTRMEQAGLYDYDDMILGVISAMETQPELRFNLQEKYQYVMVDEFQDTNLAQLRIVFDLMDNPAHEGAPNIMAVGDDDQAIYSFQGADVNNIHKFRERYPDAQLITLVDNYRSVSPVLTAAREVISQGTDRLEDTIEDLDKHLIAHRTDTPSSTTIIEHATTIDEHAWLAGEIARRIGDGAKPDSITVIARKHAELVELLPYLDAQGVAVNYERRDNVLEIESFQLLELLSRVVTAIGQNDHSLANSLMPELVAHPAFAFSAEDIWRLSLRCYRNRTDWLEQMVTSERFNPMAFWLIEQAKQAAQTPLELILDELVGVPATQTDSKESFRSPLYEYYFGVAPREQNAEQYLSHLDALRTVRTKLREYHAHDKLVLQDFVTFVDLHRDMNASITTTRKRSEMLSDAINLMTAHKSKGLEFDTVYIIGAVDSTWGERVRSRSRLIGYPANLRISPAGDTVNERVRLFYVAMTRARRELIMSYAAIDGRGKDQLAASFLTGLTVETIVHTATDNPADLINDARIDWVGRLTNVPHRSMKSILAPVLEDYKLSATHLNNFIDITRGGPTLFLLSNLLHFPQSMGASASYGTAIHRTLQRAHNHLVSTGSRRPLEDILGDFTQQLRETPLTDMEFETCNKRGIAALSAFLAVKYGDFSDTQRTEVNFAYQGSTIGDARLSGSLDLIDVHDKKIIISDYKTGTPAVSWTGKTDYEKIKLHKYRQQLMFYELLISRSRDYSKYEFAGARLEFVEPTPNGRIITLEADYTAAELADFSLLVKAVWQCIMTLDLPDISSYPATYKGVLAFERDIIDKYSQ